MAAPASTNILALNSGSSSLKFALYQFEGKTETLLARGAAEEIGHSSSRLKIDAPPGTSDQGAPPDVPAALPDHAAALGAILNELGKHHYPQLAAVGHRLVNGGPEYAEPQRITPEVLDKLHGVIPLAPLHLPAALKIIESVEARFPSLPQVACFDTAFHRHMPERSQQFPLPRALANEGVRRYGFHGLSYEYIMQTLSPEVRSQRIVIAHLGNGASLAAVQDGHSVDTTMGLTPTGGIMMGTRSGDLDPGILFYLIREKGYDADKLEQVLDHESGLLGVSGISSDMKELEERSTTDERAQLAIEMFCYAVRKQVGAYAAALSGMDTLIFAGGIGEHSAAVREEICRHLGHLGVTLDSARNQEHSSVISALQAACVVRIVATNEELMIARHTRRVVIQ